jgi:hypothetical protein
LNADACGRKIAPRSAGRYAQGTGDPLPFGLAANLPTENALESYAYKQQLIPRRMSVEELPVDSETA